MPIRNSGIQDARTVVSDSTARHCWWVLQPLRDHEHTIYAGRGVKPPERRDGRVIINNQGRKMLPGESPPGRGRDVGLDTRGVPSNEITAIPPGFELGAAPTAPAATASAYPGSNSGLRLDPSGRPDRIAKTPLGGGRLVHGRPHGWCVLRVGPPVPRRRPLRVPEPTIGGTGDRPGRDCDVLSRPQKYICRFRLEHERRLSPV